MASNRHRGWTEDEINEVVRLYTIERRGTITIGRHYGVADGSIRRLLRQRGVDMRKPTKRFSPEEKVEIVRLYREENVKIHTLQQRFGVSRQAIRGLLILSGISIHHGNRRIPFSPEQRAEMVARYGRGEWPQHIGEDFNCCYLTVQRVLKEEGVELRSFGSKRRAVSQAGGYTLIPRVIYGGRRMRAIRNGCDWSITIADVNAQFERQKGLCFYTGIPMKTAGCAGDYTRNLAGDPLTLSIDRRDSDGDYTPDNIVLCCRFANFAKNQWDEPTFRGLMAQAAQNLIGGPSFAERRARSEESVAA